MMKTPILFAACFIAILCSCGKNPLVAPGSNISATINGVPEKFDFIDSVGYSNSAGWYTMSVSGKSGTSDTADVIQLTVFSKTAITTGTYTFTPVIQQPSSYALIVYSLKGSHNFVNDYVVDYTGAHPIAINISQLSKTHVQGTFNGTLIVAAGSSGTTKDFTDGQFNLGSK